MTENELIQALQQKTIVLTVTPGRSGSTLLTRLLDDSANIHAEHEPHPRLNFVMRSIIEAPSAAANWLINEKLPFVLKTMRGDVYAETSHLVCKGFIEPLLEFGLQPKFIILTRPASEVAQSLFKINCIPERTENGRLVLLGPSDPGVLPLRRVEEFDDYQLCYWYALEIERRQAHYEKVFSNVGISSMRISMNDLPNWESFVDLVHFVSASIAPSREAFDRIVAKNQNPAQSFAGEAGLRALPTDLVALEQQVLSAAEEST